MKYIVTTKWSGPSRGVAQFEVEADSVEEAEDNWWDGELLWSETMRDDIEHEVDSVEEAKVVK